MSFSSRRRVMSSRCGWCGQRWIAEKIISEQSDLIDELVAAAQELLEGLGPRPPRSEYDVTERFWSTKTGLEYDVTDRLQAAVAKAKGETDAQ